jgi:hypothetical protein
MLLISVLTQHYADGIVTYITHDLEWKTPIWWLYDRGRDECLLEGVEGYEAIFIKVERSLFGKKTIKGLAI